MGFMMNCISCPNIDKNVPLCYDLRKEKSKEESAYHEEKKCNKPDQILYRKK